MLDEGFANGSNAEHTRRGGNRCLLPAPTTAAIALVMR